MTRDVITSTISLVRSQEPSTVLFDLVNSVKQKNRNVCVYHVSNFIGIRVVSRLRARSSVVRRTSRKMYHGSKPRFPSRSTNIFGNWRRTESGNERSKYISTSKAKNSIVRITFSVFRSHNFSGKFDRIDPNAKFLEDEQETEGIHLVTDFNLVREIQCRLGECAKGPTDFFPAMWPVTLSTENIRFIAEDPYDVIAKVSGTRYLLYVDPSGQIFLENMTQHVFRVDQDRAVEIVRETILDGIFTREKVDSSPLTVGRLTFVIQDAIRFGGVDLTHLNIGRRIGNIKVTRLVIVYQVR